MKNLLIATDFSENARCAANYGYALATQLKVNIIMCNAYVIPAEMPMAAGAIAWPQFEDEELIKDCERGLNQLKAQLYSSDEKGQFHPTIHCMSEIGTVAGLINELVTIKGIGMVVMGTHGSGGVGALLLGNHSRAMIDEVTVPLLLVPPAAQKTAIKKVAFATDFKDLEKDLAAIYALIPMLKILNAELLITHINDSKIQTAHFKKFIDTFLVDISNNANYPNIYYRMIKNGTPERGLDWLCEHGQVDVLAMVHRKHSLLSQIIKGSHTQKMANQTQVPLLVIPEKS